MEIRWKGPKDFNLIPPELLRKEEFRRIQVSLVVTGAIIFLMTLAVFSLFPAETELFTNQASPSFPKLELKQAQLDLMQQRLFFSELLGHIGKAAEGKVWLSSLLFEGQNKTITFFGQGYSTDGITEFIAEFQESAAIKNGKILSLSQDEDMVRFKWEGALQ